METEWRKCRDAIGAPPIERAGHTAIITSGDKLLIYGGYDSSLNPLNDLIMFDLSKSPRCSWANICVNRYYTCTNGKLQINELFVKKFKCNPNHELSPPPPPRCYHTSVLYENKMIVFGGNFAEINGEVYCLDLDTYSWTRFLQSSAPPDVKIARKQHSASIWKNMMVVFGGNSKFGTLDSLIMLDMQKCKWSVVRTDLRPRSGHKSFVKGDLLFLVGGGDSLFSIVDLNTGKQVAASNFIPSAGILNRKLLTVTYDDITDELYLFGGYLIEVDFEVVMHAGCTNQLDVFHFKTGRWDFYSSSFSKEYPYSRCGHSASIWRDKIIMFGGCDRLPLLDGRWTFCDFSNSIWFLQRK